jgi:hypothetical protein
LVEKKGEGGEASWASDGVGVGQSSSNAGGITGAERGIEREDERGR